MRAPAPTGKAQALEAFRKRGLPRQPSGKVMFPKARLTESVLVRIKQQKIERKGSERSNGKK